MRSVDDSEPDEPLRSGPPETANVQGLASIPTVRLERRLGRLTGAIMTELKAVLAFAIDLE